MKDADKHRYLFGSTLVSLLQEKMYVDVPLFGLSMFPFYLPGDVVRVEKASKLNLLRGNIIIFTSNDKLVAHRLLAVDHSKQTVLSKGDGLLRKDEIFSLAHVHGVVIHHFRKGRELRFVNYKATKLFISFVSPGIGRITFLLGRVWNKYFSRLR